MPDAPLVHQSSVSSGVELVRMQNPPVNMMGAESVDALSTAIDHLQSSGARAVIFTGMGGFFSAGGDIRRFTALKTREQAMTFVTGLQLMLDKVAALPMPVIAAINGTALGGGLELALACDIRIAGSEARLGLPETRWGLLAGAGGTQRLARLIGPGRAKAMMFTAESIDADEALRIGLVDSMAPGPDPLQVAIELAEKIVCNSSFAVRQVKRCVNEGLELPLSEGLLVERELWADLIPHGDYLEGAAAFFDRRPPEYAD